MAKSGKHPDAPDASGTSAGLPSPPDSADGASGNGAPEGESERRRRNFVRNMRQRLEDLDLSQIKLASMVDMPYGLLRNWTNKGVSRFDKRSAKYGVKIAEILGFKSPDELFADEPEMVGPGRIHQSDLANSTGVDAVAEAMPDLFAEFTDADWEQIRTWAAKAGGLTEEGVIETARMLNHNRSIRWKVEAILASKHRRRLGWLINAIYRDALRAASKA